MSIFTDNPIHNTHRLSSIWNDWLANVHISLIDSKKERVLLFNNLHIFPQAESCPAATTLSLLYQMAHTIHHIEVLLTSPSWEPLQQQCHVQIEPNWPINWYFMKTQTIADPKNSHTLRSAASQVQLNRNMSEIKSAHHTTAAAAPAPRIEVR